MAVILLIFFQLITLADAEVAVGERAARRYFQSDQRLFRTQAAWRRSAFVGTDRLARPAVWLRWQEGWVDRSVELSETQGLGFSLLWPKKTTFPMALQLGASVAIHTPQPQSAISYGLVYQGTFLGLFDPSWPLFLAVREQDTAQLRGDGSGHLRILRSLDFRFGIGVMF